MNKVEESKGWGGKGWPSLTPYLGRHLLAAGLVFGSSLGLRMV